MHKNRFFLFAIAFAIVAVGAAAFAPAMGLNSIAFAQSGSGVIGGGDPGGNGIDVGNGASAAEILAAISGDSELSVANFVGYTISTAGQGSSVALNGTYLCWGPEVSQCSNIQATGNFQVVGTIQETGALIILHAGKIRLVFV